MHKKFEINWTKIKGVCQSERKVVTHNSKSDLPLKSLRDYYEISKTKTIKTPFKSVLIFINNHCHLQRFFLGSFVVLSDCDQCIQTFVTHSIS